MIPFFGYLSFGNPFENGGDIGLTLSMVSTVVANVTGLMTGGLYLLLRSSTISSVGPKDKLDEYERQQVKYQIRTPKASDADFNSHIMKPVTIPQWLREIEPEDKRSIHQESDRRDFQDASSFRGVGGPSPLGSNAVFNQTSVHTSPNDMPLPLMVAPERKASASYTLFPNKFQKNRSSKALLPSTTYSADASEPLSHDCCDMLVPPPSIQPFGFRHRRDSSMGSSATVQIGLRLSNVQDVRPMTVSTIGGIERTHELGCPNNPKVENTNRPSPLITTAPTVPTPNLQRLPRMSQMGSAMKTLPPVPQDPQPEVERAPILNPTVYSPNSPTKGKVPSPRGVGFDVPIRSNTTPIERREMGSPVSRLRGNSAASGENRADWI